MIPITIGRDMETGWEITIDPHTLRTHVHLIGATGSGKTTAIETLIRPLMMDTRPKCTLFCIDMMGGLSEQLIRWFARMKNIYPDLCKRLLYINPSRHQSVMTFNPLLYNNTSDQYYSIARTIEVVLRAFSAHDLGIMPRLANWTFAAFSALSYLGFPIAISEFLLQPGTDEHDAIILRLPRKLQNQWSEIFNSRNRNEALRLLESTRNHLAPFFNAPVLMRMFGSRLSAFDAKQFIRDKRIVIINLGDYGSIDTQLGKTIGGIALNEILNAIMTLPTHEIDPTYILLDEFQNFVGEDLYSKIPVVRQKGGRFILSHQSFSQLEQGDVDLRDIIWQARSRFIFANNANDADLIAHELASLTFDPMRVKDIRKTRKQRIAGQYKEWLKAHGSGTSHGEIWGEMSGERHGYSRGNIQPPGYVLPTETTGNAFDTNKSRSGGGSRSQSENTSERETIVPIYEDFEEISNIVYTNIEEWTAIWGKKIRTRMTGECFATFVDNPKVFNLKINRQVVANTKLNQAAVEKLLEENFANKLFRSAGDVDRELAQIQQELLTQPPLHISHSSSTENEATYQSDNIVIEPSDGSSPEPDKPFRKPSSD